MGSSPKTPTLWSRTIQTLNRLAVTDVYITHEQLADEADADYIRERTACRSYCSLLIKAGFLKSVDRGVFKVIKLMPEDLSQVTAKKIATVKGESK